MTAASNAGEVTHLAARRRGRARSNGDGTVELADSDGRARKQADVLVDIAAGHILFRAPGGDVFAEVQINGHREVHAIDSKMYREILAEAFLRASGGRGCNRNALADATTTLSARARFNGEVRTVWLRAARGTDGSVIVDTGADDWSVIAVDALGWEVNAGGGEVMFRRAGRPLPLPMPVEPGAGDFARLWRYVNVLPADRVLVAAFVLGAFKPEGPYPIAMLSGEQGAGKSTTARLLKRLIDPSAAPLRAPPKDVRDLLVAALNGWVLSIDNLSWLPPDLSDALCRISTGGAISEREFYTNTEEILIEVQRPMILNGIEELASRPDLAQRAIHIELPMRDDARTESDLWQAFEADAPFIFGAVLNALSGCVAAHGKTDIHPLPRMADFAAWAAAGIRHLGFSADEFLTTYRANQDAALSAGAEGSAIGRALIALIDQRRQWTGTASDLLAALEFATDKSDRGRGWPKSARAMSAALNRLGPALRACGITKTAERTSAARVIELQRVANPPTETALAKDENP